MARQPSPDLPKLYKTDEVAEHLKVNVRTVRRWIAAGKLVARRIEGTVRVTEDALKSFIDGAD